MYYSFFGLTKEPFSMSPDPSMLYMTEQHRECIAGLVYAVMSGKGLIVLSGDIGAGKTTALARLRQLIPAKIPAARIFHTTLNNDEFWDLLLIEFGLEARSASKAQRLVRLREFLLEQHQLGITPALIVDEAHKLGLDILEELRLLSNLEADNQKLLAIVLAGQLELNEILRRDDMRQLKQRVTVRLSICPMHAEDVPQYIQHRWNRAGAVGTHPFTPEAIEAIVHYSGCSPRFINSICDNSLLIAFAENTRKVEGKYVREAVTDLDILNEGTASKAVWTSEFSQPSKPAAAKPEVPSAPVPAEAGPQGIVPSVRAVPAFCEVPDRKQSLFNRWVSRMRTA